MSTVFSNTVWEIVLYVKDSNKQTSYTYIQGGAQNVIPLIVHITHFYYYKSI